MTFEEFQTWTRSQDAKTGYKKLTTVQLLAHFFEEAGELARSVNRTQEYRDEVQVTHRKNIKMEIVDVLWFVTKIANRFDISIEKELIAFVHRANDWPISKHEEKLLNGLSSLKKELGL